MLLLIAVANVPIWASSLASSEETVDYSTADSVDSVWLVLRTMLVDRRSFPLFAMLFGFGLMVMINRRVASGTRTYLEQATGGQEQEASPAQVAWAREQATIDARRLVRRRGWWMILFGAVHGVFFTGDIIGAYGLAAVIFAGWLAHKHRKRAIVLSSAIALLVAVVPFFASQMSTSTESGQAPDMGVPWVVSNLLFWMSFTVVGGLVTLVVPSMFIGARLADTDLLAHPERHRRLLVGVGLGGLGLGALGALRLALGDLGLGEPASFDQSAYELTGLAGACGWLALLALYAGGPRPDGELRGLRWLASAVGRRSMTAYLSQTLLFGLVFVIIPWLVGSTPRVGEAGAGLIAVGVWAATVVLCAALERAGHAGPFETALRTAVARSQRQRSIPLPPSPPQEASAAASPVNQPAG
ncbi:DUF418 domain-containing protein [Actinomyces slackii]|uniref:Predicted membrane protein n=2 Tax=Actinomyces slackii TaxID=52774 RepID=A0A448K9N7_9ACTO|nr:Predicted membrane protein [Actinomyces slackii]